MSPPEDMVISGPKLPPRTMSGSMVLSQPGSVLMSHHQRLYRCSWSRLLPEAMLMTEHCAEMVLPLIVAQVRGKPSTFPHTSHQLGQVGKLALGSWEQSCPRPSPALERVGPLPVLGSTVELTLVVWVQGCWQAD